ncbi:MAG: hypothetical protein Q4D29_03420 [Lachnospiraceae bacterium]|nr:hypothetical protein [Lachnospiraceae bacterium]
MESKSFVKKTIAYTVAILIIIAVIMVIIDPFSHFHMPLFGMGPVATDERTALIGIAKNDTYETALIGSSMSENFVDSWFEDGYFGKSAVKFCLQGAHFDDYEIILDEVIKHPELKTVVFGLDNYILTDDPSEQEITIPEYLYNDSVFDDSHYVWNKSAFTEFLPMFLINNIKEHGSDDNAYVWEHLFPYGKAAALASYTAFRPEYPKDREPYDTYFENADLFLSKFTKYIEARPDVKFYVYAPPYSILFWDYSVLNGRLEAEICLLERVYSKLLEYDNVELYYFQDDMDIITNLDNYRDYSHYKQAINYYMYTRMRDGKKRITKDDYYDVLIGVFEMASSYDYDSIFK